MTPTEFMLLVADIIMTTIPNNGRLYGDEPMTNDEIDSISDRILILCAQAKKEKQNGNTSTSKAC